MNHKYFVALSKEYPTIQSLCHEIIHLKATINLPKGTEHYISDLHGEYDAFKHLMNTCSGVIKEKAIALFETEMTNEQIDDLCAIIYYPLKSLKNRDYNNEEYRTIILYLMRLARYVTSKYTRTRVREYLEGGYDDIIDELLHAQLDEMDQHYIYHLQIIDTIIELEEQIEFIKILSDLIKYFAIDHLHILGDIYDRGSMPDKIMDDIIKYQRVDIQWGNHDVLWMGAYLGQEACMITVVKNCLHYDHIDLLERGYGIPLRKLMVEAMNKCPNANDLHAMEKYCYQLQVKLESQLIENYPELKMDYRVVEKVNAKLTSQEIELLEDLKRSFMNSKRLKEHMEFMFDHGSMYLKTNHNLLLHGCIPLDELGNLYEHACFNKKVKGRAYFDLVNQHIKIAYHEKQRESVDYLWYLWCGDKSPLCGRRIVLDKPQVEVKDYYYEYIHQEEVCEMLLKEFNLHRTYSLIINGHTPVRAKDGQSPLCDHRRLVIIDGGFCVQNQEKTGVAGYTLISNSHGMRIKTHHIHEGTYDEKDTEYDSEIIYTREHQEMLKDTKRGESVQERIDDLITLLDLKRRHVL